MIIPQKINFRVFTFAEEGLISSNDLGEGRMIPVLVLDVEDNQDIPDLLKIHRTVSTGDVKMTWAQDFFNKKDLILKLQILQPMQFEFGIRFSIDSDHTLIDGIIQSKGFILQTGKKGDKVSKKLEDDRIHIEIPETGVKELWDKLFFKAITEKYRKIDYSKKESKKLAKEHIGQIRELWKIRRGIT